MIVLDIFEKLHLLWLLLVAGMCSTVQNRQSHSMLIWLSSYYYDSLLFSKHLICIPAEPFNPRVYTSGACAHCIDLSDAATDCRNLTFHRANFQNLDAICLPETEDRAIRAGLCY